MKKGIVLEVHDDYVTMLTPEGEFLKSRKQKAQVGLGEEIIFFPLHRTEDARKRKHLSFLQMRWAVISVLTAIILIFSLYPKYVNNQVYAYISLDVNPSLELGLNKNMQVISIEAYNEEGKLLISELQNWKKKELTDVSSELFELSRKKGYLTSKSEVIIASVLSNEENIEWKKKVQVEISLLSKTIQVDDVSVTTIETTNEKRGEALKIGVSPGKYIQNERETELAEKNETSYEFEEATNMRNLNSVNTNPIRKIYPEKQDSKEQSDQAKTEKREQHEQVKTERKEQRDQAKTERREQHEQVKIERKDQREHERTEKKEGKKHKHQEHKQDRKEERVNDKHPKH